MSAKRYTEEFKIEAVKQITERGYKLAKRAVQFFFHSILNSIDRIRSVMA